MMDIPNSRFSQQPVNDLGQPVSFAIPRWVPPAIPEQKILCGRFGRLEPLDPAAHSVSLYEANRQDTDGRMWTYLSYGPFETLTQYRAHLSSPLFGDPMMYAVIPMAQNRAVGLAGYHTINPACGSLEIGHVAFSPVLQGTTAATEAIFLLVDWAFTLGYRRCQWRAKTHNIESCAAARRLGFSFEGIFRQSCVVKGRNWDTAWYSILDHEWPALRAAFQQWLAPENFDVDGRQRTRLSDLTRPLLHDVVKIEREA